MKVRLLFATLALLSAAGCGGGAASGEGPPGRSTDLITAEEVHAARVSNAYELVQSLRPRWLTIRGAQSFTDPGSVIVYHDHVRLGGPESLRSIPVSAIASLHFLDGRSATQRWGTGHNHGAILVRAPTGPR